MITKPLTKHIDIHAPREKVWDVLFNENYTRIWYAEFSERSHIDTDWQLGSKAIFTDHTGDGIAGKIIAHKPHELLSIEYHGVVRGGKEDCDSETAKRMQGACETYRLSEKDGDTHLAVECDMEEEHFDMMSQAWDRALDKVKELAEGA